MATTKPKRPPAYPLTIADPVIESSDAFALVRMDDDLIAMFRDDIATVREFVDPYDVPTWDRPWDPTWWAEWPERFENHFALARFCHAVGSIRGYAATLDVTPCDFIAHVEAYVRQR